MPFCYCHKAECVEFDLPVWVEPAKRNDTLVDGGNCAKNCSSLCLGYGACTGCAERRHLRPSVPLATQRFRSVAVEARKPLPAMSKATPQTPARFYCQNPNQSGDTTGVGMALAILGEMNLLFLASMNAPNLASAFLTYYQDMGARPERVVLLVGDAEAVTLSDQEIRKNEGKRKKEALAAIAEERKAPTAMIEECQREEARLLDELKLAASAKDLDGKLAVLAAGAPPQADMAKRLQALRRMRGMAAQRIRELALREETANKGESGVENDALGAFKPYTVSSDPPPQGAQGAKGGKGAEKAKGEASASSSARPALEWKDIALADMSIDVLVRLLRTFGWPACPLFAPSVLTASRLGVDKPSRWLYVDPGTALDVISSEMADLDRQFHDAELTLTVLPGWLDGKEQSSDPLDFPLALRIARRERDRIGQVLHAASRQVSAHHETLQDTGFRDALLRGCGHSGVGLYELLGHLRAEQTYKLFLYECSGERDKAIKVLLFARSEYDVNLAVDALELPQGGKKSELCKNARIEERVQNRAKRFRFVRDMLQLKLTRRLETARRYAGLEELPAELVSKLSGLAGRILPWAHFDERAGNQLYQGLTALAIGLREVPVALPSGGEQGYQTLMRIPDHQYYPIGDTSRHILAVLQRGGVHELTKRIAGCLRPGCEIVGPALRKYFLDDFVERKTRLAGGKRPTFVLIWVRGVNASELGKLIAGMKGAFDRAKIDETQLGKLDSMKRNPHHVMTPQLCAQLTILFECFNQTHGKFQSPDPSRYFVPVPIGDRVHIDQYDHASKLVFKEDPDNMINLWARDDLPVLKDAIGGTHWRYRQVAMMRELFMDERFDLMQIGIRSGAIEQGMYQVVPSVYIEEHMCATGDRMVSLTREGPARAVLDQELRKIHTRIIAGGKKVALPATSTKPVPEKTVGSESTSSPPMSTEQPPDEGPAVTVGEELAGLLAFREACDLEFIGADPQALREWEAGHGKLKRLVKECAALKEQVEAVTAALAGKSPSADSSVPPQPDPTCGGFPLFFRLVTAHLVGLNQARTEEALDVFTRSLLRKLIAPTEEDLLPAIDEVLRVERGALHIHELFLLCEYVKVICLNYKTVCGAVYRSV